MAESLKETIDCILQKLASEFVYRKLGICYDYPTFDNSFPLKSLPKADEVCNSIPDSSGRTTGMYNCTLNNALLFDGLADRFEIGFGSEQDDLILDRLIGGTIRLGTVAPKNVIVRGLTGDGRYFYPDTDLETALLWAFTAWRTVNTTTVAIDSQQKIINISSRWINKLNSREYQTSEESSTTDLSRLKDRILLSGILAVCSAIVDHDAWHKEFSRIFPNTIEISEDTPLRDLLVIQISLYLINIISADDTKVTDTIRPVMSNIAVLAEKYLGNYKNLDPELLATEFDSDWREFNSAAPLPALQRITNEEETVTASIQSMQIIMYSNDTAVITKNKELMITAIQEIPWEKLVLATSLTPLAAIHAKGVELKLWDEKLNEFAISFAADDSLVAEFLTPDYDDKHQEKAGHINSPKKKPIIEIPQEEQNKTNKKKRKRRKRSKSANTKNPAVNEQKSADENSASTADKGNNTAEKTSKTPQKKNPRNRRNKRKRAASSNNPEKN